MSVAACDDGEVVLQQLHEALSLLLLPQPPQPRATASNASADKERNDADDTDVCDAAALLSYVAHTVYAGACAHSVDALVHIAATCREQHDGALSSLRAVADAREVVSLLTRVRDVRVTRQARTRTCACWQLLPPLLALVHAAYKQLIVDTLRRRRVTLRDSDVDVAADDVVDGGGGEEDAVRAMLRRAMRPWCGDVLAWLCRVVLPQLPRHDVTTWLPHSVDAAEALHCGVREQHTATMADDDESNDSDGDDVGDASSLPPLSVYDELLALLSTLSATGTHVRRVRACVYAVYATLVRVQACVATLSVFDVCAARRLHDMQSRPRTTHDGHNNHNDDEKKKDSRRHGNTQLSSSLSSFVLPDVTSTSRTCVYSAYAVRRCRARVWRLLRRTVVGTSPHTHANSNSDDDDDKDSAVVDACLRDELLRCVATTRLRQCIAASLACGECATSAHNATAHHHGNDDDNDRESAMRTHAALTLLHERRAAAARYTLVDDDDAAADDNNDDNDSGSGSDTSGGDKEDDDDSDGAAAVTVHAQTMRTLRLQGALLLLGDALHGLQHDSDEDDGRNDDSDKDDVAALRASSTTRTAAWCVYTCTPQHLFLQLAPALCASLYSDDGGNSSSSATTGTSLACVLHAFVLLEACVTAMRARSLVLPDEAAAATTRYQHDDDNIDNNSDNNNDNSKDDDDVTRCRTPQYAAVFRLLRALVSLSSTCASAPHRSVARALAEQLLLRLDEASSVRMQCSLVLTCPYASVVQVLLHSLQATWRAYNANNNNNSSNEDDRLFVVYECALPHTLAQALQTFLSHMTHRGDVSYAAAAVQCLNWWRVLLAEACRGGGAHDERQRRWRQRARLCVRADGKIIVQDTDKDVAGDATAPQRRRRQQSHGWTAAVATLQRVCLPAYMTLLAQARRAEAGSSDNDERSNSDSHASAVQVMSCASLLSPLDTFALDDAVHALTRFF